MQDSHNDLARFRGLDHAFPGICPLTPSNSLNLWFRSRSVPCSWELWFYSTGDWSQCEIRLSAECSGYLSGEEAAHSQCASEHLPCYRQVWAAGIMFGSDLTWFVIDDGPAPNCYRVSPGLGKQWCSNYRSSGGFGFGREMRGYESDPKVVGPGPGAHYV